MKNVLLRPLCIWLICVGMFSGCASTGDLNKLSRDLNQKNLIINERMASLDLKLEAIKAAQESVQVEMLKSKKDSEANFAALRRNQADGGVDITSLRGQVQQLRGQIEELRKDFATSTAKTSEENKKKIDAISFKVNFIENFLDIGKKSDSAEKSEKSGDQSAGPKETVKEKTDKESLYAEAHDAFKDGKYDKARTDFQSFLKQFPNTEHSDDAQFWIGESYYFERKYEKAILEYEKVVKSYPEGDKVSYALMKQGLSFLNLGDKASAKLILQQVIKDFPNTNQARIAREKLLQIK